MIHLIRLVTLRSIAVRRSRTFLSAFGIILGVASLFAIQSTNEAAYVSITRLFQGTSGRVNLEIHANDLVSSFPEDALNLINGVPDINWPRRSSNFKPRCWGRMMSNPWG